MRAAVVLENFLEKLSFLNHAVSTRAQLPALTGILIETERGKIRLSATDLEMGITTAVSASVEKEGAALVPAKPLTELLATLTEEKVTIEKEGRGLKISGKKTAATITCMDEKEFPKIVVGGEEEAAKIKKEGAVKEFSRTVFAASQDTSRPAFSGVLIKKEKEKTTIVATDSHRLSLNTSLQLKTGQMKAPAIVPAKTIKTLLALKGEEDISVSVSEKNNQIVFSQGETTLVGRLIDAEYPDFEKIIPVDSSTRAEFDRIEMLNALKTAAVFARENANIIRLSIRKNSIDVFAKGGGVGENKTEVSAKTTGEENEIAFNIRYLLELLQNLGDETIVFEMTGPLNPGVFKLPNDPTFIHLIMPIRVSDKELQG